MRVVIVALISAVAVGGIYFGRTLFPRPPREAAELVEPILRERVRADDSHYEKGSHNWNLEEDLDHLARNTSPAADDASVILLDYYLGEHNGETQICAVTRRGDKVLPLLHKYRQHRAGVIKPWFLTLRLNREERDSMYETCISAVRSGKVIGCDE